MREDQYHRLQALGEKLTDAFLTEADPVNWTGDGMTSKQLTQQERGDRYWCKKNAAATAALIHRTLTLVGRIQLASVNPGAGTGGELTEPEDGLDREIAEAETIGKRMLAEVLARHGA